MKYFFGLSAVFLAMTLVLTELSVPRNAGSVPVLYWTTDANPARVEQVRLFQEWLKKNDYPEMKLLLDTANRDQSKLVIQGVSGVAGDVLDVFGDPELPFFQDIGLLEDVTEEAQELGFGVEATYEAIAPSITVRGRQFAFPCNVSSDLFFVNHDLFRSHGVEPPSGSWNFDTFERVGKEFVAAANEGLRRQEVFFADTVPRGILWRSLGVTSFNETMTACVVDDPRAEAVYERVYRWTYEDHLLPSSADLASIATQAGYGSANIRIFAQGTYAMVWSGRWAVIGFRQGDPINLGVVEAPAEQFRNTGIYTRAAAVYAASEHIDLAKYFLAFLASEPYNMQVVLDGDSLPPVPSYTRTEEFLRPPEFPNEGDIHEKFAESARTISIASDSSPFVLGAVYTRLERQAFDSMMAGIISPAEAVARLESRVNVEIARNVENRPELKAEYDKRVIVQKQIEERLRNGEKVPVDWILNPYHRKYYEHKGWLE